MTQIRITNRFGVEIYRAGLVIPAGDPLLIDRDRLTASRLAELRTLPELEVEEIAAAAPGKKSKATK